MHHSMSAMLGRWLALASLVGLLAGCGGATSAAPTAVATATVSPSPAATPPATRVASPAPATTRVTNGTAPPATGGSTVNNPAVQAAIADLARQRNVDATRIRVVTVEEVEWSDAALGCPEPGRAYAQVITPGWRITLSLDGQTVVYHTDRGNRVVLCTRPAP